MLAETEECIVDPITLSVVFAVGYGVCEGKSRMRRRRYYHADSPD
jgi:hypothetical protein